MRVAATSLSIRFDGVLAVDSLTFAVPSGRRVAVWGPAGSGKTTLLKALAGLVRPTSGHVEWGDVDVTTLSPDERRASQANFGMVFQSDALFDSMTVLGNVLLPLTRRGVPSKEAHERATEALERVGLGDAADKHPEALSGGMKKRCGVARAIVSRPSVLLADDPFAGLDPATEASIAALLLEVSAGRTLIAALPDPVGSLPVDERWLLSEGRLA